MSKIIKTKNKRENESYRQKDEILEQELGANIQNDQK